MSRCDREEAEHQERIVFHRHGSPSSPGIRYSPLIAAIINPWSVGADAGRAPVREERLGSTWSRRRALQGALAGACSALLPATRLLPQRAATTPSQLRAGRLDPV